MNNEETVTRKEKKQENDMKNKNNRETCELKNAV